MPSTIVPGAAGAFSGGVRLVSGLSTFSGTGLPRGGVQLFLDPQAPGPVYVGVGDRSGDYAVTITSGGALTSGGLRDGMLMSVGAAYFVPQIRLVSGLGTIHVTAATTHSGGRLFWETF